ncbi:hypothetical protein PG993_008977 [Apiospora rasikravindrae]|uniref:Uncharacterized protein n=1 Tax=Apiospora rasikravindrae TaxID=990691 RepID=A0ABR1SIH7_9PEZI
MELQAISNLTTDPDDTSNFAYLSRFLVDFRGDVLNNRVTKLFPIFGEVLELAKSEALRTTHLDGTARVTIPDPKPEPRDLDLMAPSQLDNQRQYPAAFLMNMVLSDGDKAKR